MSRSELLIPATSTVLVHERSPSLELLHADMHPIQCPYRQPLATMPEAPVTPELQPEPIGQPMVATWAARIRCAVPPQDAETPRPRIHAADAETAGQVLAFLVRWLFDDPGAAFHGSRLPFGTALQNFVGQGKAVTCNTTSLSKILAASNNLDIRIGEGIGPATVRTTLRLVLKLVTGDGDLWEMRGQYASILFHASHSAIPVRRARLRACGFLSLLHMVVLHAGPDPISPFLLRAAIEDRSRAMSADASFLRVLDPDTYKALAPWVERDQMSPLRLEPLSPLGQLLMSANINPLGLSHTPSEAELQGLEYALVSEMVLGEKDVSTHPDILAFSKGLHHVLAPGSLLDIAFAGRSSEYLAFMYDRRLHKVSVLIDHLEFRSGVKAPETIPVDDDPIIGDATWDAIYKERFTTRISEYLQGCGHPNHPHITALLDPASFAAAEGDSLLHARGFLQLMSGSDLLPTNPSWKLKFHFQHTGQRTTGDSTHEPPMPAPLGIHACFYEANVTVDEGLRNLLNEERQPGGHALAFDAWLHGPILSPDNFSAV
ncbi:hypothetical protein NUW54_g11995 [Trametes sanguinea]|uniref:Uncharacterized protein n=1 Tax=Trametes sanguinea TaxID=158606 RepID=A0ACC1N5V6_9APHY|nr:hypothetical protein NUW54_g11995 [Trametes sanguinea]